LLFHTRILGKHSKQTLHFLSLLHHCPSFIFLIDSLLMEQIVRFVSKFYTALILAKVASSYFLIDNEVIGKPEIECGPEKIGMKVKTKHPFEGSLYLKNWRRKQGCFAEAVSEGNVTKSSASLSIPLADLAQCGMEFQRNQQNGDLTVRGVWVVSFHPLFITKVDRAFDVLCIFKQNEVNMKSQLTVRQNFKILDMNDLVTLAIIPRTVPVPSVMMKIVSGSVPDTTLPPVTKSKVGNKITFIWYITDPSDIFGLRVRECTAENKRGLSVKIVENGCSTESVAIREISYEPDNTKAYATSQTFKFADQEDIWFQCRVLVCTKLGKIGTHYNSESCEEIKTCGHSSRSKRNADVSNEDLIDEDETILEQHMQVLELYNQNLKNNNDLLQHIPTDRVIPYGSGTSFMKKSKSWRICMKKWVFSLTSTVTITAYIFAFIITAFLVHSSCGGNFQKDI
ncbi:Cuticlin-1, partial [Trichinella pseudospiralis]